MRNTLFLGAALAALAWSTTSNAGIIYYEGGGNTGTSTVNLRTVSLANASNDIYGDTVGSPSYEILFHSNSDLLYTDGTGQAKIRATEVATDLNVSDPNTYGVIGDLTFGPTGAFDMTKAIWNVDVEFDSDVFVSGIDQDGVAFTNTFSFTAAANGSNWITAEAVHGQTIDTLTISGQSIVGISDLQQFRVGVTDEPTEVTAPSHVALLSLGLCGLFGARMRK